ncbi:alpha/beta fold hydrolase [Pediococcus claussenii]|uniref:Alpha/beta hydrolase fold family protein n=1 Tax=Pediococcus claussenii (strain ATCC BAA-344 / DSM 14800 / JCM 18046 / KCTC 3811 / LMG 21948 / P06) TaxID=701521 RepID=G8PAC9_PEDCP|nr:alpha/beta hydrolase [Pediococcus claussenii]AEV94568.1 alpha/beta hydrolase fold family protein [Pediococcus claussenii ATCC BAA-344]ANZ69783.1 alpha/beta hydrolase [Pediococcus claussenii]ANZ71600.1 alpha/beta hydrolase [Pediococcus claussenii]KRN19726.1 hypothetical protein IV79_GL001013 [Pediococcus claussenii]
MFFKTSDRIKIAYDDQGTGQPIILLAGIGSSRHVWDFQVNYLVEQGYRVINIDARNQGESQHTSKGLRITRHAIDVYELLQELKVEKPIMIGNSMGAATFWAYISLYGDKNIKALIDVDQSPKMINDSTWSFGFKQLNWENFPDDLLQPFGRATHKRIDDQLRTVIKTVGSDHPYDAEINYPFLRDHAFQDWRDIIRQLRIPFLVVAGSNSPFFNPEFAKVTAQMAPAGEYTMVEDCGHIVMAEQSVLFNQTVQDFIQKIN